MEKSKKKIIIGLVVFVAIIAALTTIFFVFKEKPVEGTKSIVIEVIGKNQDKETYIVKTDGKYLEDAMREAEGLEFDGVEGDYGFMIDTINGQRADYTLDGAFWSFYINGEMCNYGISEQPIQDGDIFTIEYTPAGI